MKDRIIHQLEEKLTADILKEPDRKLEVHEPLISSGIIDSFSLVDFALFIEDTFNVLIDDTELNAETFDTLDQLAELIISRLD